MLFRWNCYIDGSGSSPILINAFPSILFNLKEDTPPLFLSLKAEEDEDPTENKKECFSMLAVQSIENKKLYYLYVIFFNGFKGT